MNAMPLHTINRRIRLDDEYTSSLRLLHLLILGHSLLGDIGEHGGALCGLEVLGARLLKQSLWLRSAHSLALP